MADPDLPTPNSELRPQQLEVVPTLTSSSVEEFSKMLSRVKFAQRLHLDFMDGQFTLSRGINLIEAHWPEGKIIDLHLMFERPAQQLETAISLAPHLVIVHAEAQGNLSKIIFDLQALGIKAGVALLQPTTPASATELVKQADHVLIFTGKLGFYGGRLQPEQLVKIAQVKAINPKTEIAIDGGINDTNAQMITGAGADILNVGGYIMNAANPKAAYTKLIEIAQKGRL